MGSSFFGGQINVSLKRYEGGKAQEETSQKYCLITETNKKPGQNIQSALWVKHLPASSGSNPGVQSCGVPIPETFGFQWQREFKFSGLLYNGLMYPTVSSANMARAF